MAALQSSQTPLDRAAFKGKVDVVRLLIERGAEVDSRDKWGWTPLHLASRYGHLEVSRVLIDHGANVNARKHESLDSATSSAYNGHLGIVKLLLERGADVHALNEEGQTPYQESLKRDIERLQIYSGSMAREEQGSRISFYGSNAISD
jgi:ankyrin repeat protein